MAFSNLTCHLEDTGIVVFDCILPSDIKETELESSDQEASPSADLNTGVALVPCCTWKCVPIAIFGDVDISKFPGCHLL